MTGSFMFLKVCFYLSTVFTLMFFRESLLTVYFATARPSFQPSDLRFESTITSPGEGILKSAKLSW